MSIDLRMLRHRSMETVRTILLRLQQFRHRLSTQAVHHLIFNHRTYIFISINRHVHSKIPMFTRFIQLRIFLRRACFNRQHQHRMLLNK
jgi:hypothetical protein